MQIQNPQLKRVVTFASEPRIVRAALWLLTALLLIAAVWLFAKLTWQVMAPKVQPERGPLAVSVSSSSSGAVSTMKRLAQFDLFGAAVTPEQGAQNAPKTRLNVRLLGVSASNIQERSAAIIEKDRRQEVYVIGDSITGSRVTIEEIYADRVILNNNGVLETLELEGIGELSDGLSLTLENQQRAAQSQPVRARQNDDDDDDDRGARRERAREAFQQARANGADGLMNYVRISPSMADGGLQGYRLSPGKFPEVFADAGFKSGDIAVALNGQDLTDVASAQVAIEELKTAQRIIITVLRDENYIDLELAVPSN
ncbi:type II secretion system protein GspC [Pseudidiomarina sediminum]|uniref:Type II secretion system protein GspC n=1 Tax=Pseudidiomarina sediminum TaxID=431675 RepID=A0A432ZB29_9GAMM|nr:type II secretion system protein GspC [Pseudidiomarina sediminum]RUO74582.1 type II secretion system protein GspC [Pseudidiomarina sediminum]